MFHNGVSRTYSDSPKYIAEYLLLQYPKELEIVFSVSSTKESIIDTEKRIRFIKFQSFSYCYFAMTSKVFVTNNGGFAYLPLRKSQFVLNTWHGGGTFKRTGIETLKMNFFARKDLLLVAKKTDAILSSSRFWTEFATEAWLINPEKFWGVGLPRNDLLLSGDVILQSEVRERLGLHGDEQLVLYAPTMRRADNNPFSAMRSVAMDRFDPDRLLSAFCARFGGKWRLGFRQHPGAVSNENMYQENVINLTAYPEMQELLLCADALISDYSSSMWDFCLMKKPCFVYAEDLIEYAKSPGFLLPPEQWPYPIAHRFEELIAEIEGFDELKYQTRLDEYFTFLESYEQGDAASIVGERVAEKCCVKRYN